MQQLAMLEARLSKETREEEMQQQVEYFKDFKDKL